MIKRVMVGAGIAGASWIGYMKVRRWWTTWGVDPVEQTKELPGDEIVPEGETLISRGITIEAPPEAVWPWLVQMGYDRAGWYSYDQLDMKGRSADAILPEFQQLRVGDIVPTHDAGGFEVKLVEPNRALVLYLDTAMVEAQQGKRTASSADASILATETPGLAMSGGFLGTASPKDFKVSWTFVLEPAGHGRTRLIERCRGWFGQGNAGSKMLMPVMGFGVFVMMQRQMVGLRRRIERTARFDQAEREATIAVPMATSATNGAPISTPTSPAISV
jgi:hypothetical protein